MTSFNSHDQSAHLDLRSLTYMSNAVRVPTQAEIEHLLSRARLRNRREQVTGLLLYDSGSFLQVIEGPHDGVQRVYAAILADPLHHNVLELLYDGISQREFPDWSMAYRAIGDAVNPSDALLAKLDSPPSDLNAVHHLLAAFWNRGLGSRYDVLMRGKPLP